MSGRTARLLLVCVWSLAEATVSPIMPDALLVPLAAGRPPDWWRLAFAATGASAAGGLVSGLFGRVRPVEPLLTRLPLVRPAMVEAARLHLRTEGPAGVRHQPLSGLPFKVYALLAGHERVSLVRFLCWSVLVRGVRFYAAAGSAALIGRLLAPTLRRQRWRLLVLWAIAFALGLRGTVTAWERRATRSD